MVLLRTQTAPYLKGTIKLLKTIDICTAGGKRSTFLGGLGFTDVFSHCLRGVKTRTQAMLQTEG